MRRKALEKIPTGPIISDPAIMVRQEKRYAEVAAAVFDHGGSSMHARAAVRMEMDRTFAINRSNELFDDPPMRRDRSGLGHKLPVLEDRNLPANCSASPRETQ